MQPGDTSFSKISTIPSPLPEDKVKVVQPVVAQEALALDKEGDLFYLKYQKESNGILSHQKIFEIFRTFQHTIVESVLFSDPQKKELLGATGCINRGLVMYCHRRYSKKLDPDSTRCQVSLKYRNIQKVSHISSATIDNYTFEIIKNEIPEFFLKNYFI